MTCQCYIMDALVWVILVNFLCLSRQCGGAPMSRDTPQDDELRTKIDDFVDTLMVEESMIGLTLAVTKDGQPFMTRGYGTTTLGGNIAVTKDTLFYLDKGTQTFTATLLAMLLDQNERYTMDTAVQDIYPDFHVQEPYRCKHTSLRDILSHRVGYYDTVVVWYSGAVTDRKEYIRRARFQDGSAPFRSAQTFNDIMYAVAGEVAGILKGASFEDTMFQELLQPLGMTGTTFMYDATSQQQANTATPYIINTSTGKQKAISMETFSENIRPIGPSSALLTNANDMQKWLAVLSNKGQKQDGSHLISQDVLEETMMGTSYAFALPPPQGNGSLTHKHLETGAALGWYSGLYRGYRMATNPGFMWGYHSLVTVLPDVGTGIYIGINGMNGLAHGNVKRRIADYVFDLFLGYENSSSGDQDAPAQEASAESSDVDITSSYVQAGGRPDQRTTLENYVGMYGHYFFGNITVTYNETNGLLKVRYGYLGRRIMYDMGNDTFLSIMQDPLWFVYPIVLYFAHSAEAPGGIFEMVTIPRLYPESPPTFTRGLKMADAPPHNDRDDDDTPVTSHAQWLKSETAVINGLATVIMLMLWH